VLITHGREWPQSQVTARVEKNRTQAVLVVAENEEHTHKVLKENHTSKGDRQGEQAEAEVAKRAHRSSHSQRVTDRSRQDTNSSDTSAQQVQRARPGEITQPKSGRLSTSTTPRRKPTARESITFLDTPGHAAFTDMSAQTRQATDIVVCGGSIRLKTARCAADNRRAILSTRECCGPGAKIVRRPREARSTPGATRTPYACALRAVLSTRSFA